MWYEEDAEWSLVALRFPYAFSAKQMKDAIKLAKEYYPDDYQTLTGQPVKLEESWTLRRRAGMA